MACFAVAVSAIRALSATLIAILLVSTIQAQIAKLTDHTFTPFPGAGHDYIKMLSETVNPANSSIGSHIHVSMRTIAF